MKPGFVSALFIAMFTVFAFAGAPCAAGEDVRVMVMDGVERLTILFPASYDVRDTTGMGVVSPYGAGGSRIELGPESSLPSGIRVKAEGSIVSINQYALTGTVDVKRNAKGLFTVINELGIEDYTRAVIGEEMDPRWPVEALKAQAVATRTYALYKKARADGDYDLCSTVNSQVFTGDAWLKDGPARAVEETRGLVLTYGGELAETLYHGSCGGVTEDASRVWDKGCGYLVSAQCECNSQSPYARWTRKISEDELRSALAGAGYGVGVIRKIAVAKRSASGRASSVRIEHGSGTLVMKGNELRRALGYSRLPSTFFFVVREGDGFVFTGSGSGHGVGLCQWGAKTLAEEGWDFERILAHYYPRLKLSRMDGGGQERR